MNRILEDAMSWAELSRLLDTALTLPPAERLAWLNTLPPEHAAFEPRLRALLARAAEIETNDFLSAMPRIGVSNKEDAALRPPTGRAGDTIGPYRLIREIGSGGMGAVWLAERTDGILNRPVALKLPHLALRQANLVERMAREREILATLAHPHIARLYDAGVTPQGQPYLALEYVEGVAVDEYCATRALGLRERLQLVLQITSAVAYAHGKLVVHRDLKPANVLVTSDGDVRLLDFGVAKLLEEGRTQETALTQFAGPAFTPDYASPEQIRGEPLGTASDIYSLGVMLFRLVTGERPYRVDRESRGALEEAVLESEALRPSEIVARPLRRDVRGDLDTIILTCLKKNPDERYATVHALADDIERLLDGRPVLAQPDTHWYRTRKFLARHRLAVGSAGAVLLAIVAAAGVAFWQARVATAERDRALRIQAFIGSIFQDVDPGISGAHEPLGAVELLDRAQQRIDRELADEPETRAELRDMIARAYAGLFQFHQSASTAAAGLKDVEEIGVSRRSLAATLHRDEAEARKNVGELDAAAASLDRFFALYRAGGVDDNLFAQGKIVESSLKMQRQDFAGAIVSAQEVVDLGAQKAALDGEQVGEALGMIAQAYASMGKSAEALDYSERAYRKQLALHEDDHANPAVIQAENTLGVSLLLVDFARAAPYIRASLENARKVYGPDSLIVAHYSARAGQVALETGELTEAIELLETTDRIEQQLGAGNTMARAGRLRTLGRALLVARRPGEAIPYLERAKAIADAVDGNPLSPRIGADLAFANFSNGSLAAAGELRPLASSENHLFLIYAGNVALRSDDLPSARAPSERSVELARKQPRRSELAEALMQSGLVELESRNLVEAEQRVQEALGVLTGIPSGESPLRADANLVLGRIRLAQGKTVEALPLLEGANSYWQSGDSTNAAGGEAALWLGRAYRALDRESEAAAALSRAHTLLDRSPFPRERRLTR
jgi:serine/threonine-protein kinase